MSEPEPEPVVEAEPEAESAVADMKIEEEEVEGQIKVEILKDNEKDEPPAKAEPAAKRRVEIDPTLLERNHAEADPAAESEPVAEPAAEADPTNENSHLFAVRTTGGQEKIVMRMLEARLKMGTVDLQSVLLLDDLKGYVVVESRDVSSMFNAIQGLRHVRGQLRGELGYNEIEKYLVKKSVVTELEIDKTVEIIGGPFKGMKATVSRVDKEKEEATVVLLDAAYELPITVDANYLKLIPT